MDDLSVYICFIEVKPMEGGMFDPTQIAGAAMQCFIPAPTGQKAYKLLIEHLKIDQFELIDVFWFVDRNQSSDEAYGNTEIELISDAYRTGDVVYGEISIWEHEDGNIEVSDKIFIFVFLVEIVFFKESIIDSQIFEGAFVKCFLPSRSIQSAFTALYKKMKIDNFGLIDIHYFYNTDTSDWGNPDDEEELRIISEARNSGEIAYGEFDSWKHGEIED